MQKNIPWWHPSLGEQEKVMLGKVIDRQFPNHSIYTVEFEKKVAALAGVPYAVAVTSGTAALFLSLKAAGVGQGHEVIIPDITFIATAHAVSLAGATPVFADVHPHTLSLDPSCVERAITSRTKAVIPVHISGRSAHMKELLHMCDAYHIPLIEDAAEALGSCGERPLGSLGFAGCFSFTATKLVTTGQGGVIVTRDEETYYQLRALRDHGRPNRGTGAADIHDTIGYNFKFTDLQAAVGIAQLDTLQERLNKQKNLYLQYKKRLGNIPGVRLLPFDIDKGERPLWVDALAENRDSLLDFLFSKNIETRKFWYPIHRQKPYLQDDKNYPVTCEMTQKAFWLPSAISLTEDDINYVCDMIEEFYKAHG
jgi:perosamine synthetase